MSEQETGMSEAKSVSFKPLEGKGLAGGVGNLDMVMDVPLKVRVQLGSTKLFVKDLLQLGQGSVVELDKAAGQPLDVYVGDKLVARGDVVVVNEKFGVKLTDIVGSIES
jgi:flagellar motor switch protein FliN/FliY